MFTVGEFLFGIQYLLLSTVHLKKGLGIGRKCTEVLTCSRNIKRAEMKDEWVQMHKHDNNGLYAIKKWAKFINKDIVPNRKI